MEFIVLDINETTEEQLLATINANVKTAKLMSSEIKKLKQVSEKSKTLIKEDEEERQEQQQFIHKEKVKDDKFEDEVAYYYSAIKSLTAEELSEKITELLPSRDNRQYENILYRLQAEIMRNIKELKEFILTEQLSESDRNDLEEEMLSEQEKNMIIGSCLVQDQQPEIKNQAIQKVITITRKPTIKKKVGDQ